MSDLQAAVMSPQSKLTCLPLQIRDLDVRLTPRILTPSPPLIIRRIPNTEPKSVRVLLGAHSASLCSSHFAIRLLLRLGGCGRQRSRVGHCGHRPVAQVGDQAARWPNQ